MKPLRLRLGRIKKEQRIRPIHLGDPGALLRQFQTICETDSPLVPKARDCESI
jgi:hypothetical protein